MTQETPLFSVTFSSTTGAANYDFVTTAALQVGDVVVIACDRSNITSNSNGVSSVTTSAGGLNAALAANATRASTHDLEMWAGMVNSPIPAGSTITMTYVNVNATRRVGVLAAFRNVVTTPATAYSAQVANGTAGSTTNGITGSGTLVSVSTISADSTADILSIGAVGTTAQANLSLGSGYTTIGSVTTTVGSGDRGVVLGYKVFHSGAGTAKTMTGTFDVSTTWAAALASFPIAPAAAGPTYDVVVSGVKKSVASANVIVGGVKKPVANVSVIIGGVKKPIV